MTAGPGPGDDRPAPGESSGDAVEDVQSAGEPIEDPVEASADPADAAVPGDPVEVVESVDGSAGEAASDELTLARMEAAERTADLQRLQAEFVNYKRRVERDRELLAQNSTYKVLSPVVEVLDTIDRAREHGELEGGLKSVADQLERVVAQQGLVKFGEPGDAFDPNLHEALSHLGEDPEVQVQTCKVVAKAGYRIGERVVRAAQVLVVDPA